MNSTPLSIDNNFTNFSSANSAPGVEISLATSSYRLIPPPSAMIGELPVRTVSFILLGVGAAAPIIFLTTVAAFLRFRTTRLRRHYSKYVLDGERSAWNEDVYLYNAYTMREPSTLFHQERQLPPENEQRSATRETSEPRLRSDHHDDPSLELTIGRFFGSTRRVPVVDHCSTRTSIEIARKGRPDEKQTTDSALTRASPSTQATVLDVNALSSLPGKYTPYAMLFSGSSDGRIAVEIPGDLSSSTVSRDSGVRSSLETNDSSYYFLETPSVMVSHSFQSGQNTGTKNSRTFEVESRGGKAQPVQSMSTMSTPETNSQRVEEEELSDLTTEEEKALRCLDDALMEYMN